jgi:hypothetical protein
MRRIAAAVAFVILTAPAFAGVPSTCPMMTFTNVFFNFQGTTSGCSELVSPCQAAETINFNPLTYGYDFACATHTFSWDFGDGTTATGQTAAHTFARGGTYTVSLIISNPFQTFVIQDDVNVVSAPEKPTVNIPTLSPAMLSAFLLLVTIVALVRLRG